MPAPLLRELAVRLPFSIQSRLALELVDLTIDDGLKVLSNTATEDRELRCVGDVYRRRIFAIPHLHNIPIDLVPHDMLFR